MQTPASTDATRQVTENPGRALQIAKTTNPENGNTLLAYTIEKKQYLYDPKTKQVFVETEEFKIEELSSRRMRQALRILHKHDENIAKQRTLIANTLMERDPDVSWLLIANMRFLRTTTPQGTREGDITFYQVGRNSSHEYELGIGDDGKKYYRATDGTAEIDEEECSGGKIKEVTTFEGMYLGHL